MSRRDGGDVAVSTAMESQRKGSTPPSIYVSRYIDSFVENKRSFLCLPYNYSAQMLSEIQHS